MRKSALLIQVDLAWSSSGSKVIVPTGWYVYDVIMWVRTSIVVVMPVFWYHESCSNHLSPNGMQNKEYRYTSASGPSLSVTHNSDQNIAVLGTDDEAVSGTGIA